MHRGKIDPGIMLRGNELSRDHANRPRKGRSPQVEVKSTKTKENGISYLLEKALIHQTREILTPKPTFIIGVSEKLLKNGEHKSPPVHTFIWRFELEIINAVFPIFSNFLGHPVFIINKTNTRTKRLT